MARADGTPKASVPGGIFGTLAIGAIAVLLAALPYSTFDLERHAVPKELALVLAAGLAGWLLVRRARTISLGWAELALVGYAIWTVVSLIAAERWWPGIRATGVTLAGLAVFAAAAALGRAARGRLLLAALVLATALAVATALAQAHGAGSALFSESRAPGGLFGNRNFMAHAAVAALALLVPLVLRGGRLAMLLAIVAAPVLMAGVVISRSRAAWLAAAAGAVALTAAALLAGELARGAPGRRRLATFGFMLVIGGAAAILVPNELRWRSDAPYLESLRGVADYQSGSGRGRLVQYRHTVAMAAANPLLGVGPGNWSIAYPRFTSRGDPAFAPGQLVPTNPWPSSDWLAIAAERGIPAIVLLIAAGLLLLARAVSRLGVDPDRRAGAIGGLTLLAVALVIGCFDAQLLLPVPSLLIMGGLGALLPASSAAVHRPLGNGARTAVTATVVAAVCLFSARLLLETTAMHLYEQGGEHRVLAAKVDPGNYRIRALLAQRAARAGRCAEARRWATAAARRMPDAPFPETIMRRCGLTRGGSHRWETAAMLAAPGSSRMRAR